MTHKILVTGSGGYIGNALMAALSQTNHHVMSLDNGDRDRWVKQVGGCSLTDYPRFAYINVNLQQINDVVNYLQYFKPTIIFHLASQPSGPYSEISHQHRLGTQVNNLTMLVNILSTLKDLKLDTKLIVATTTGVPGAPNGPILEDHCPNIAGSWYHVSRGFDSANLQLAAKQWKLRILELRTSIVYGTRIKGINQPITRLDWDFWFGTVVHRFCLSSKTEMDIKIYGKGLQEKPFISLDDCVQSFINCIDYDVKPGHEIMNQTTHCMSPKVLAEMVGGSVVNIPNPRVENEEYKMDIKNDKFMKLLGKSSPNSQSIKSDIDLIKSDMDVDLLPTSWRNSFDGILIPQL